MTKPDEEFASANEGLPSRAGETVEISGGRYKIPFDPFPTDREAAYRRQKNGKTSWMRVTRLASAIQDGYTISQWRQRMVAVGIARRPALLARAAALDPSADREALNGLCDRAKDAADEKGAADLGTALHGFTEARDNGLDPYVPPEYRADVDAWSRCLTNYGLRVTYTERMVIVRELGVMGTLDRVVALTRPLVIEFDWGQVHLPVNTNVVADLKSGRDLEYAWHEISVQLALYAHGDLMGEAGWAGGERGLYVPPRLHQGVALVIHLPVGTGEATLYGVDIERGWRGARLCRAVLDWRGEKGLGGALVVGEHEGRALEWIAETSSVEGLGATVRALKVEGLYIPAVQAAARAKLAELRACQAVS